MLSAMRVKIIVLVLSFFGLCLCVLPFLFSLRLGMPLYWAIIPAMAVIGLTLRGQYLYLVQNRRAGWRVKAMLFSGPLIALLDAVVLWGIDRLLSMG